MKRWIKCRKCGKIDEPDRSKIPHNVGTSTRMYCKDCQSNYKEEALCRDCCPTGHGTRLQSIPFLTQGELANE